MRKEGDATSSHLRHAALDCTIRSATNLHKVGLGADPPARVIEMPDSSRQSPDCGRGQRNRLDLHHSRQSLCFEPVQTTADCTAALRAIRRTTKNTWLHSASQVGRVIRRHSREETFARVRRRMNDRLRDAAIHQQLRIASLGFEQLTSYELAICASQHFITTFPTLRRVSTDPDPNNFRPGAPERDEFVDVALALQHRARNRSVNVDLATPNVGEDSFISCRCATGIMMLRQTVDRHCHSRARNPHPLMRNWDHRTRHHHRVHFHFTQYRQYPAQLAMTYKRFPTHEGNMQRTMIFDQANNPVDQFVPASIAQTAEGHQTAQMRVAIGVATRTVERTFPCDFNGKHRGAASQDRSPRAQQLQNP